MNFFLPVFLLACCVSLGQESYVKKIEPPQQQRDMILEPFNMIPVPMNVSSKFNFKPSNVTCSLLYHSKTSAEGNEGDVSIIFKNNENTSVYILYPYPSFD